MGTLWEERLEALRERPQEWARFGPYPAGTAYVMRTRLTRRYSDFEFTARKTSPSGDQKRAFLFARYLGDD